MNILNLEISHRQKKPYIHPCNDYKLSFEHKWYPQSLCIEEKKHKKRRNI